MKARARGTCCRAHDVNNLAPADRVAYAMARGSYAEYAVVHAWQLVKIPATIDFQLAAAQLLQGNDPRITSPLLRLVRSRPANPV